MTAVDRRHLLRLIAGAGLATLITPALARVALAAPSPSPTPSAGVAPVRPVVGGGPDVLVVVSLRGGVDGLSVVAPLGDRAYARARPGIAVPAARAKQVSTMFGLHPALAPLTPLWDAGRLAAVHAVGQNDPTRSHFEATNAMERAAPGSSVRTGWLDRTVELSAATDVFTASQVGSAGLPASLYGDAPKMALAALDQVKIGVDPKLVPLAAWHKALSHLHAGARDEVTRPLADAVDAVGRVQALPTAAAAPVLGYPATQLGKALHDVARLVRSGIGLRYATVDHGGWDMHSGLGTPDGGRMQSQLTELAAAVAAFARELGPELDRVTLITISEFGRRVEQNGSGGLDHGHGGVMLLMGGGVVGGRVHGRWPGLAPARLDHGDLAVTTDYRDVIGEVLTRRCGVKSLASVFPGLRHRPLGVVRSR